MFSHITGSKMWLFSPFVSAAVTASLFAPAVALAQANPAATASSAANAAGTTVNSQNNSQINTNTFYGFGPGISCPTASFSVAGFGGGGAGSSAGDTIGANVNSGNYGGIASLTFPIGGANSAICQEIGKAQVESLKAQAARTNLEAAKTQADINLVTALKCVELLKVAVLAGPFQQVCSGIYPRGLSVVTSPAKRQVQTFTP
ncbi:MAG: hypothetical protein ACKOCM_08990 [Cyanobacteriota bacterium]